MRMKDSTIERITFDEYADTLPTYDLLLDFD